MTLIKTPATSKTYAGDFRAEAYSNDQQRSRVFTRGQACNLQFAEPEREVGELQTALRVVLSFTALIFSRAANSTS